MLAVCVLAEACEVSALYGPGCCSGGLEEAAVVSACGGVLSALVRRRRRVNTDLVLTLSLEPLLKCSDTYASSSSSLLAFPATPLRASPAGGALLWHLLMRGKCVCVCVCVSVRVCVYVSDGWLVWRCHSVWISCLLPQLPPSLSNCVFHVN